MGWGCAAATTDHLDTEILDEVHELHLQLEWLKPVMGDATNVFRKTGVGNTANGEGGMLREVANVLLHLLGPRRAVQPEDVDRERLKNGDHGGDVRADQHGAGGFHGDRHHQWPPFT